MLQGICNKFLCISGRYGHERRETHSLPGPPVSLTLLRIFGESKQQLWEAILLGNSNRNSTKPQKFNGCKDCDGAIK